jgi:hypothetical protein
LAGIGTPQGKLLLWRIILKYILKELGVRVWNRLN